MKEMLQIKDNNFDCNKIIMTVSLNILSEIFTINKFIN